MTTHPVPPAGVHGGDGPAVAAAMGLAPGDLLDLSQNLNPFAPPAAEVVRRHADTVGHYPDARAATVLLAEAIGVDPGRLLLTNGGSEAIHLVATELGGRVDEPEFALHPRGVSGPRWRTDPHSPTGRLAASDEHADVWDEAFHALATGEWSAHRPGITVGSLTKTFACPGLRMGYVVADDVARFARHQPHWSVSALSLSCLPDLLESADLATWSRETAAARTALATTLTRHGLEVEAHHAPWVLVHGAAGLREALAPHGVLVRDCASFAMPGTMRIAVPRPEDLPRLERALDRRTGPAAGTGVV